MAGNNNAVWRATGQIFIWKLQVLSLQVSFLSLCSSVHILHSDCQGDQTNVGLTGKQWIMINFNLTRRDVVTHKSGLWNILPREGRWTPHAWATEN